MITGDQITSYRILTLRKGLELEIKGLRLTSRGRSCYSMIKTEFNFRGNKAKVLALINAYIENNILSNDGATGSGKVSK